MSNMRKGRIASCFDEEAPVTPDSVVWVCVALSEGAGAYSDVVQLELVEEGLEGGGVLPQRGEAGGEHALETRGQVGLPPHLPQAEHTLLTAHQLDRETHTHTTNNDALREHNATFFPSFKKGKKKAILTTYIYNIAALK